MYQEYLAEIEKFHFLSPIPLLIISIFIAVIVVPVLNLFIFRYVEGELIVFLGLSIGCLVFLVGSRIEQEKVAEIEKNYKSKAPTEWVVIQEESLYSMKIQEKSTLNGSREYFVSLISMDEITDYKYTIKTEQGYQLRTLSKQEKELQEDDIFVKEEQANIQPKLIIEQRQYKEAAFNKVFTTSSKRVTFVVPEGTISNEFKQNK